MKTRKLIFSLVLLLALFLAACSTQVAPTEVMAEDEKETTSDMSSETMDDKDNKMMEDENSASDDMDDHAGGEMKDDDMMSDDSGDMDGHDAVDAPTTEESDREDEMTDNSMSMESDDNQLPDWFKAPLMDVNSGETFKIGNFKGKVVLVETLAMWCSNCLKQQGQVLALHELVGERDDFISVGLDIDPNENADALKAYATKNGFDWVYTVAPTEISREIGKLYGDQYLNPPSTPMLIIDREGEVHLLPFGIKSAEDLLEALQPFLDEEM